MARKKVQEPIKWNKKSDTQLKKAISDFNMRVKKLRKARKDVSYIPEEIGYRATKKLITTESELSDVLSSLRSFRGTKAFKKVTLKSGESLTAWEYENLKAKQKKAKARVKKELLKVNRPYGKMGTIEFQKLKSVEKSIKDFEKLRGNKLEIAIQRIENFGSSDFEMRRAVIYKENYLSMLKEEFQNETGYRKLRKAIKDLNPIDFYNNIKIAELGEKLKDITFMYDFSNQGYFDVLIETFLEEEEVEKIKKRRKLKNEDDEEGD